MQRSCKGRQAESRPSVATANQASDEDSDAGCWWGRAVVRVGHARGSTAVATATAPTAAAAAQGVSTECQGTGFVLPCAWMQLQEEQEERRRPACCAASLKNSVSLTFLGPAVAPGLDVSERKPTGAGSRPVRASGRVAGKRIGRVARPGDVRCCRGPQGHSTHM